MIITGFVQIPEEIIPSPLHQHSFGTMASLRTSALAAACMLLFVLALCEASRAIPSLRHELSADAESPVLHDAMPAANGSAAVNSTSAQPARAVGAVKSETLKFLQNPEEIIPSPLHAYVCSNLQQDQKPQIVNRVGSERYIQWSFL
jgi:hypothetical protein